MKLKPMNYAEITLVIFGAFLIADSFFLHLLSFAYPQQIAWLDEFLDHWMLGIVAILIGYIGWKR